MKSTSTLLAFFVAVAAVAQQHPNAVRGLAPNGVYQPGEIDQINLFNGNLATTLPLSQEYRVGPALSYQFVLRYTGNVWDYEQQCYSGTCYTQALPDRRVNAGMGWRLSLGRLVPPSDTTNETEGGLPVYESPDGADHVFYPKLHEETSVADVWYTRDSTYLRLRRLGTGEYELDFPNGTTHRFDTNGWLVEMRDRTGNYVRHAYTWGVEGLARWTITEGNLTEGDRRTHAVDYTTPLNCSCGGTVVSCSYAGQLPATVTLASFNGQQTVWTLSFSSTCIDRGYGHTDPNVSSTVQVHLLTQARVTQPSSIAQAWRMTHDGTTQSYITSGNFSGLLQRVELPSAGRIEWSYSLNTYPARETDNRPHRHNVPGVSQRRMIDAAGQTIGTWTHEHQPSATTQCSPGSSGPRYLKKVVTDPAGHKTNHYFSTYWIQEGCDNVEGWTAHEYSLPLTRHVPLVNGRFLSSEVLQAGTTLKRSRYATYERDSTGLRGGSEALSYTDVNRRLQASRVIYRDDGGRFAEESLSDFDGLGHYRTTVSSGNFSSGNDRTTRVNFNPSSGTYPGSFVLPPPSGPWILGTYDLQQTTEGSSSFKSTYCFDANSGFMNLKRVLAGTSEGASDIVTRYTADPASGEMIREEYFGGDVQALGTTSLCSLALPAPQYRIDHTWRYGSLATSRYVDGNGMPVSFLSTDRDIDRNTGLTIRSRDTAVIVTHYEYDALGRLTLVRPEAGHGGATKSIHTQGTSSAPPRVDIEQWNNAMNTVLARRQSVQDAFGRPWKEKAAFPGYFGSEWSTTETTLDALGRTTAVSSTEAADPPVNRTLFADHDAFGRPGRIRPPDGDLATGYHVTSLAYEGARIERSTSTVRTGGDATSLVEEAVTVTREYDRRGRLYRVIEPTGPNGESVTTTYTYDAADRLIQVQIQAPEGTQTRTFTYDGRGFLLSETRPELGATGNGTIYFHEYDARGHARRRQGAAANGKFDLRYVYDSAERLTSVAENAWGRPVKQFVYGTANGAQNWKNGKLVESTRWNATAWVQRSVKELYEYGGTGGRVSRRTTTILNLSNGTTERSWDQSFVWNDLGRISRLGYPTQTVPSYHGGRNVDFGYGEGRLTGASGYFSMYYHPNGLVGAVSYAGGPRWTQHNSPQQMARPGRILSGGTTQNWDSGDYRYDGSGNIAAMGSSYYLYDKAGRVRHSAEGGSGRWYSYDSFGNRGSPAADPLTNRLTGTFYAYDEAGNLTKEGSTTLGYDWLSGLTTLSDSTYGRLFDYIYTAGDERIASYDVNLASWTWTLRDLAGNVVSEYTSGSGWTKDYIHRDGTPAVAVHAGGTSSLFMVDHRGTPRQITPWDGSVSVRHDYHAFGEEITNPASDTERMKFGGFERDFCCSSGGIGGDDRQGGLFYSSTLGRLRSVTLGEDPSSPQTWNGYAQPESGVRGSTVLSLRPTIDNENCRGCPKADMEIVVVGPIPITGIYIPVPVWRLMNPPRPAGGGTAPTPQPPQPQPPQPQPQQPSSKEDRCRQKADDEIFSCRLIFFPGTALAVTALDLGCMGTGPGEDLCSGGITFVAGVAFIKFENICQAKGRQVYEECMKSQP